MTLLTYPVDGPPEFRTSVVPARSFLHHLRPVGLGTQLSESLTGYVARLALAHALTPASLFGRLMAPLSSNPYVLKRVAEAPSSNTILASSFRARSGAMNGPGACAEDWVRVLESLTLRSDLKYLTLIPWKETLSAERAVRPTRAWCPACYQKWLDTGETIYEPLLWALGAVSVCTEHLIPLTVACRHCDRYPYHLTSHSKPGHCSSCGQWLGEAAGKGGPKGAKARRADFESRLTAARYAGEMIAAGPTFASCVTTGAFARSVELSIRNSEGGSARAICRTARIPTGTLGNWRRGEHKPTLGALLRFCDGISTAPLTLLAGISKSEEPSCLPTEAVPRPKFRAPARERRKVDRKKVERELRAALKESPPPSMTEMAGRLGHPASALRYQFHTLCGKIVGRRTRHKRQRRLGEGGKAHTALERALADESHPSVAEVARSVGWNYSRLCRRFPELCRAVSRKHRAGIRLTWWRIGQRLREALTEKDPPPMSVVVERLGRCEASLYAHFPSLCRRITARHEAYRKAIIKREREEFLDRVRSAALSLHSDGVYPSVRRVEEALGRPKSLGSDAGARVVLRKVREDLNLEPRVAGSES